MSSLHPTPSRGFLRRVPLWAAVVVAALLGLLLIGAGLLLTTGDDKSATPTAPVCTPTPVGATTPPSAPVKVNVYNSTDRAGLARDTADAMESRGFRVDDVTNDPKKATIAGTAVVRHVRDAEEAARWVAAQVPDATLQPVAASGRSGTGVDLVIGKAFDGLADEAAAAAAFAASVPRTTC